MWPAAVTVQAGQMLGVWRVFIVAGIVVYAIVAGLIIFAAVAYRSRDRRIRQSARFHENKPLEIVWTVIPILIVIGLFVKTYVVEAQVEHVATDPPQVVKVVAFRWSWSFAYPQYGITINGTTQAPPQLVLPVGETTKIDLTSTDVIHEFWVPAFVFKRDAIPGMTNVFDLKPTRVGTYRGECAEYCGTFHADMGFSVRVLSRGDFVRWIHSERVRT